VAQLAATPGTYEPVDPDAGEEAWCPATAASGSPSRNTLCIDLRNLDLAVFLTAVVSSKWADVKGH
jgi:hypothetical protein